jgi:hypothetical protein
MEFYFQNKFEKLVHLFGFIRRKFVMMHGHVNIKFPDHSCDHDCNVVRSEVNGFSLPHFMSLLYVIRWAFN